MCKRNRSRGDSQKKKTRTKPKKHMSNPNEKRTFVYYIFALNIYLITTITQLFTVAWSFSLKNAL